jgi:hypothetical protein
MAQRAGILVLIAVFAACARRPPVAPAEADLLRGEVAYRFLFDTSFESSLPDDQEFESPRVVAPLATPAYPSGALEAGAGPATVAVRFVIGRDGAVVRILDCPKLTSTSGPFAAEFRQAVEEAVRSWRFTPGELRTFGPGEDLDGDGTPDYKVMIDSRILEVSYDVAFAFRLIDGQGRVTAVGSVPTTETP